MKLITVYFNQDDLDRIQKRVDNHEFSDRSDAIRYMVKTWLDIRDHGLLVTKLAEVIKESNGNTGLGEMLEMIIAKIQADAPQGEKK